MFFILAFDNEGDRAKFEYIYTKYKNLLLHKAWEILKDYSLAEDAASEAFLRVYKNLDKIQDPESGKCVAFIVTIVRNVSLTMLSREKKKFTEPIDEERADDFNLEHTIISDLSSERIYELLNELDEDSRSVFLYKFAYDMPHKEIARLMKTTDNNVTVKLHRAKKKLAAILEREGYAYGRL